MYNLFASVINIKERLNAITNADLLSLSNSNEKLVLLCRLQWRNLKIALAFKCW